EHAPSDRGGKPGSTAKLDGKLNDRARTPGLGITRAIVVLKPNCSIDTDLARNGGRKGKKLAVISGHVGELPNRVLRKLADNPCVLSIHWDRKLNVSMNRAAITLGARAV